MAPGQSARPQHAQCLVLTPAPTNPQTNCPLVTPRNLGNPTDGLYSETGVHSLCCENRIVYILYKVKRLFTNGKRCYG
jgi:hypothetical protein